jgi:ribosomal-protein-alanine N-acetyltransferase
MIELKLTTEEHDFKECALLMSQSEPWITLSRNYESCIESLQGDFKEIYIVTDSGKFIGFVILQMVGSFKGYIQTLCIKPEYRNKGIGTMVLKFCEERIFKVSPNVFICVSSFNKKAENLYLRLGYKKIGELQNFAAMGYSEFLLRKTTGSLFEFYKQNKIENS